MAKKEKAVIFDLDGTLADPHKHKQKHKKRDKDWAEEARTAPAIRKNVKKLRKQEAKGEDIIIMTARSEHYKPETKEWLKHHDIKPKELIMRPKGTTSVPDKKVKKDLLEKKILPKYKVKKAYDDRSKNIKMFKKHDIKAKKV